MFPPALNHQVLSVLMENAQMGSLSSLQGVGSIRFGMPPTQTLLPPHTSDPECHQ